MWSLIVLTHSFALYRDIYKCLFEKYANIQENISVMKITFIIVTKEIVHNKYFQCKNKDIRKFAV